MTDSADQRCPLITGVCRNSPPPSDGESAAASAIGGRKKNEDRCYHNDQTGIYVVADGMGGYQGGALASQIAVETIPELMPVLLARSPGPDRAAESFSIAVDAAQDRMALVADEHPEYQRMGCTLVAALQIGDQLVVSHLGDCRAYLFRGQTLRRLTEDETLVRELTDAGLLSQSEADSHPGGTSSATASMREGSAATSRSRRLRSNLATSCCYAATASAIPLRTTGLRQPSRNSLSRANASNN